MTSAPPAVRAQLDAAREATTRLLATVDRLSPAELTGASLLPGWTRAHVVAHLAGNARSHVRMLTRAQRGEIADQYPGGGAARAEAIDALAADPSTAVSAVHASVDELEQCWRRTTKEHWAGLVRPLAADPRPAARLAWSRWREVEVHHVDLAAGYGPHDWSAAFVDALLAELLRRPDLPALDGIAGAPSDLAAWLSGRSAGEGLTGPLPDLPEWC